MTIDQQEIERIAAGLGSGAEGSINVERVAENVVRRLRSAKVEEPWYVRSRLAQAAVICMMVLGAAYFVQRNGPVMPYEVSFSSHVLLEEVSVDVLGDVLDSLTFEAPVQEFFGGFVQDLDEGQLEQLLRQMEI